MIQQVGLFPHQTDRRERRDGPAAARLAEGPPARSAPTSCSRSSASTRPLPRPLPGAAVRRRAPARRGRPRARRRPADHAHGRAVRRGRPDRPRAAPERVPPPPGGPGQDDPVRHPRHRRGDQDGRPRRGHAGRRASSPSSAPPEEILANPASEFVARFVGADRGLKRLSLSRVGDLELRPARDRRASASRARKPAAGRARRRSPTFSSSTTRAGRSAGSMTTTSPTDGILTEDLAIPMSPILDRRTTLKDALSSKTTSQARKKLVRCCTRRGR